LLKRATSSYIAETLSSCHQLEIMRKYIGIRPSLLTAPESPQKQNEVINVPLILCELKNFNPYLSTFVQTIAETIVGTETNLTVLAEIDSAISAVPGIPDSVFDQISVLKHSMEKILALNQSTLCAASPPNGTITTLAKIIQDECDDFVISSPGYTTNAAPLVALQSSYLDTDLARLCLRECLMLTTGIGTNAREITIECAVLTQDELHDLPCTLRGSYIDAVTPRIHVSAAAPSTMSFLIVQCTIPTDDSHGTVQTTSQSPALSVQDEAKKMDALAALARSGCGFCGEMSGFAAPTPSTCCIWFALPLCAPGDSQRSPALPTDITVGQENCLDSEPAGEHENSIQRMRSLSSEEDPNAHRINTRAALDADSPAHRALRSSLAAVLPASSYSANDSKYLPAPFFDPAEAARFRKTDPFPAYKKRLSRQSLMVAVNAAFPTPRNDSPSVTPVSRWKQLPERVTAEGNFDSSGSTDPGTTGMAGLSVKGKESPPSVEGSVSANPFALPASLPAESPVAAAPPSPECVQPHNR
jgi:hypothetical protein